MKPVTARKPRVLVVGCGISGLTCGVRLLEEGFDTTIVARELPPYTTSDAAAAVWFPYNVSSHDPERLKRWAHVSYRRFSEFAGVAGAGVSFTRLAILFKSDEREAKLNEVKNTGVKFEQSPADSVPSGYEGAYELKAPLVEPQLFLPFLMSRVRELGGRIAQREVRELSEDGPHEVVVNCTGVWARELAGDIGVYPIRGQVVRVGKLPGVERCMVDDNENRELTYIFPRSSDCILGGTKDVLGGDPEKDGWNSVDRNKYEEIKERCAELVDAVGGTTTLEQNFGLRPCRDAGVRLDSERVSGRLIIHNYGHGGSGFTISWGCADEVLGELAKA